MVWELKIETYIIHITSERCVGKGFEMSDDFFVLLCPEKDRLPGLIKKGEDAK